jgi:ribosomal protein S27E
MSSSLSNRFKASTAIQQSGSVQTMFSGHHATVHCHECNRTMVPRVVIYYGQPLKSICPFCGATFARFSSGFQRFLECIHQRTLSFDTFKKLIIFASCFGLVWLVSQWFELPKTLNLIGTIGALTLLIIAAAELTVQLVEHLAAKLSHESNYYWAGLILILSVLLSQNPDLIDYALLFSGVMLLRWIAVSALRAFGVEGS